MCYFQLSRFELVYLCPIGLKYLVYLQWSARTIGSCLGFASGVLDLVCLVVLVFTTNAVLDAFLVFNNRRISFILLFTLANLVKIFGLVVLQRAFNLLRLSGLKPKHGPCCLRECSRANPHKLVAIIIKPSIFSLQILQVFLIKHYYGAKRGKYKKNSFKLHLIHPCSSPFNKWVVRLGDFLLETRCLCI